MLHLLPAVLPQNLVMSNIKKYKPTIAEAKSTFVDLQKVALQTLCYFLNGILVNN